MYTPLALAHLKISTHNTHTHPCLREYLKWQWFPLFRYFTSSRINQSFWRRQLRWNSCKGSSGFSLLSVSPAHSPPERRISQRNPSPSCRSTSPSLWRRSAPLTVWDFPPVSPQDAYRRVKWNHGALTQRWVPVYQQERKRKSDGPRNTVVWWITCFDMTPCVCGISQWLGQESGGTIYRAWSLQTSRHLESYCINQTKRSNNCTMWGIVRE